MNSPGKDYISVFITDDTPAIRQRLAGMLSELPFVRVVGQAGSVAESLAGIQKTKPDVAILDIRLPGGNGFQILEKVKKLEKPPLVIILTAFPYPQYQQKAMACGADYFLDKTTEFECIPGVLMELLHPDGVHAFPHSPHNQIVETQNGTGLPSANDSFMNHKP